ncbi:MAG: hypothetical protein HY863_15770 [Chloroflexi bacterium]|nr:hypothetical protein [Chloroflexota bacterium]
MVKKKTEDGKQKAEGGDQLSGSGLGVLPPPSLAEVINEHDYVVSHWSGREHYICKKCVSFDTFLKEKMLNHLIEIHESESALEELYGATPPPTPPQMEERHLERGEEIEKEK